MVGVHSEMVLAWEGKRVGRVLKIPNPTLTNNLSLTKRIEAMKSLTHTSASAQGERLHPQVLFHTLSSLLSTFLRRCQLVEARGWQQENPGGKVP